MTRSAVEAWVEFAHATTSAGNAPTFGDCVCAVAIPRAWVFADPSAYAHGELYVRNISGAARTFPVATCAVKNCRDAVHGCDARITNVSLATRDVIIVRRIANVARTPTVRAEAVPDDDTAIVVTLARRVTNHE